MNSIAQIEKESNQNMPAATADTSLLHWTARGLSGATFDHFGLWLENGRWHYPIAQHCTAHRSKALPNVAGAKVRWEPEKPADLRFYDPHGDLPSRIASAGGVLIITEGEPDVWALYEAGIINATCFMGGANDVPDWFTADMLPSVHTIQIWADRDLAGRQYAAKIARRLAGSSIQVEVYTLPFELQEKHGGDIGKLLIQVGAAGLRAALESCPSDDLTDIENEPESEPYQRPVFSASLDSMIEEYRAEFNRHTPDQWLQGKRNKQGFYRNFPCPFHSEQKPSAGYNPDSLTIHCFVCGDHGRHEIAPLINAPTWEQWKADRAPQTTYSSPMPAAKQPARFAEGWPTTINKRLMNVDKYVRVKKQRPAALVGYLWHRIADLIADDQPFTVGDFLQAIQAKGYTTTRDQIATGLDQLVSWGMVELVEKSYLLPFEVRSNRHDFSTNSKRGPKPSKLYQFLPIEQQIASFKTHYVYLMRESAYTSVPDNVQPEWGDLTAEQLTALDRWSADLYEQNAAERADSEKRLTDSLLYLEQDTRRILAGRYNPIQTEQGATLRNSGDYGRSLHLIAVDTKEGKLNRYQEAAAAGVRVSSLAAVRAKNNTIKIPQFDTVTIDPAGPDVLSQIAARDPQCVDYGKCELVTSSGAAIQVWADSEVDYDAWKDDHGGETVTARIYRPGIVKRLDQVSETELAEAKLYSARQSDRARSKRKLGDDPGIDPEPANLPVCIWPAYSEHHMIEQLNMRDWPDQLMRHDPETGEVLPVGQLWRDLADHALFEGSAEGEPMPTFIEASEPDNLRLLQLFELQNLKKPEVLEPENLTKLNIFEGDQLDSELTPTRARETAPEPYTIVTPKKGTDVITPSERSAHARPCAMPGCHAPAHHNNLFGWFCDDHIGAPREVKVAIKTARPALINGGSYA